MHSCVCESYSHGDYQGVWVPWTTAGTTRRTCVLKVLVDKLAKENWRLINEPQYWNDAYTAVTFTRITYTV